jgi:hypothetical protein
MKTAYATIEGFEDMRMIRRRQNILCRRTKVAGEVPFVNTLFGLAVTLASMVVNATELFAIFLSKMMECSPSKMTTHSIKPCRSS